jgi:protein TonB
MFEQALLESATHGPGARRTYSTAASVILQSAGLAAFIIVPMITSQMAPQLQHRAPLVLAELSPAPPIESSGINVANSAFSTATTLRQPASINPLGRRIPDVANPPSSTDPAENVGSHSGLSSLFAHAGPGVVLESEVKKSPPVSVLEAGVVLSRVQPVYPRLAIETRMQGTVRLHAVITPSGTLEQLSVLSGYPVLAKAATDAVRQWRFRPYVLNGNPIEVQTEIIVNFLLN